MTLEERKKEILEKMENFKKHGIRTDTKETCRFQDLIGQTTFNTIFKIYESFTQDQRRTFLWACSCTLSPESCEEIIKQTTIRVQRKAMMAEFEEWMEERSVSLDKREVEILEREKVFDACRKSYWKRMQALKAENKKLKADNQQYKVLNEEAYQTNKTLCYHVRQLKGDLSRFHALKNLLKEMKEG